eukprot:2748895-Lingulodinium_polyedra.AAC.1
MRATNHVASSAVTPAGAAPAASFRASAATLWLFGVSVSRRNTPCRLAAPCAHCRSHCWYCSGGGT